MKNHKEPFFREDTVPELYRGEHTSTTRIQGNAASMLFATRTQETLG